MKAFSDKRINLNDFFIVSGHFKQTLLVFLPYFCAFWQIKFQTSLCQLCQKVYHAEGFCC